MISISPPTQSARVKTRSFDPPVVFLEFLNGAISSVTGLDPDDWPEGTVVMVAPEEDYLERVPDQVWPVPVEIGVVRLRNEDVTVVDQGGRPRRLPSNRTNYRVGNTVEFTDETGVLRVLDEQPLRLLDLPGIDDSVADSFLVSDPHALTFDDFGGSETLKRRARELIEVPLRHSERLDTIGARPVKGVLFTGDPGTGKTMLARIIASQADAAFFEIRGPEVFSKWYGESEELLRRIFDRAARHPRAIIFFDEIDSVAPKRSGSHEASRRVVAQLLTLMDGFRSRRNVVVVATTNRLDDIDEALRRPGRFDWELHFPRPALADREAILEVSAAKLATDGTLDHAAIAERTEGWSAADLAAIFSEAALLAVQDERSAIGAEDYLGGWQRLNARVSPAIADELAEVL